jgi:uncharacterized protein YceH (UPF0502 family)
MATHQLTDVEIRILGSLMEKALSTPDYYPLSLNALTNACNQKSSRDPVVVYDERDVQSVLEALEEKNLVNRSGVGRVPKYEELLSPAYDLVPRETAVLCLLMLRGPQTVGELRSRTGRLATFENLEAVTEILEKLVEWGLARRLDRLPGRKESRYTHLFGGAPETLPPPDQTAPDVTHAVDSAARLDRLESEVAQLRSDIESLRETLRTFKAQFE